MATFYWYGGSGNWSEYATHWSDNSGNSPDSKKTAVPGTGDDVIFDVLSHTAAYTVTIDATANCRDMTWANPLTGSPTLAGSSALNIYGSLSLVSGMGRTYTGAILFAATASKTITLNAVVLASAITFNGTAGTWTLQDNLNNGSSLITLTAGTLDTNGKTITSGTFTFNGSTSPAAVLTMGASVFNCSGNWHCGYGLTITSNTSTINLTGAGKYFMGGGAHTTYNDLVVTGGGNFINYDTETIHSFTWTGTALKTNTITLSGNLTITGALVINGDSIINRVIVVAATKGTARTITCNGTVTVTNADFQDITGAGTASWDLSAATGGSGNCGGNSGITFTTADDWYYHEPTAGANNFSTVAKWFTATNGGGSVATYPPLPQDTAIFNADSFDGSGKTIAMDMPRFGALNTSAVNQSSTIFSFGVAASFFGSITFGTHAYGGTSTLTYEGRGNSILTTNAISIPSTIIINCVGGKLTLADALTITGDKLLTVTTGTFDSNEMIVIVPYFSSTGTGVRTIDISNSSVTCNYKNATTPVWDTATVTNLTMAAAQTAGSTIKMTDATSTLKIFSGGGKTYNNLWFAPGAGTGNLEVRGADTFADFKDDGTEAHSLLFTKDTTYTFTTFTISGGSAGKLKTISTVTGAGDHAHFSGTGTITVDYMDIQRNQAAPANTWYYGAGSTYNSDGNCAGWVASGATPLTPTFTDDWSNLADSIGGFRTMDASFTDDLNA